jgi:hypothetical protein
MSLGKMVPPPWDEFHPVYSQHQPPVPYSIRRRRARLRAAWIALAVAFILGGGALGFWGFPRILIAYFGGGQ